MENISDRRARIDALRSQLARLEMHGSTARAPSVEKAILQGIETGAVHDLYAETGADAAVLNGFGLMLATSSAAGRPIIWGVQDLSAQETGQPYGPGLHELGVPVADVVLVRARDAQTLLIIGEEALKSPAVGAVLLSAWGEARAYTLTASRRLALAAQATGGTLFLARAAATPAPSAALTRWSVATAPSTPLEDGAPGRPTFRATLLRHRGGEQPRTWIMEWDRDARIFREPTPLSGDLVPLVAQRTPEAGDADRRVA